MLSDTLNDCMCVHAHSMKDGKAVFPSELFKDTEEDGEGPPLPPALAPPTPLKPPQPEEEEEHQFGDDGEEDVEEADGDVLMEEIADEDDSDGLGDDPLPEL